ncbi:MAG: hypothetical protein UU34_C0002G0039 [Candidatus Curtissbacteria bacterium GW2011_GWA1_41_11]|uniref:Uncharacterized protein n=1 Tax=Candidatus Curtissbacteria bacterium GW2011_GWA1_41_11 TaxID=1618409 RepID=A0A0G0XJS1_9BACT|nr:MAG: hypothetical protein UU34_C0002G0039 [Candidatus Curtissbacteria bacterium GW2011_GWA1_41_11]
MTLSPAFLVVRMREQDRFITTNGGMDRIAIPEGRFFRASSSDSDLIEMARAWGVIRKPRTSFSSRSGSERSRRTQDQLRTSYVSDQSQPATTVGKGGSGWIDINDKNVTGIFASRVPKAKTFANGRDTSGRKRIKR